MWSSRYDRSVDYRARFIRANPPKNGMYRCAYCGRKIRKDKMQVDHVIAVGRAKKNWLYHLCIKNNINDPSNLVAACPRCNKLKGDKGGLWILRGRFWRILLPLETLLQCVVAAACLVATGALLGVPFCRSLAQEGLAILSALLAKG